MFLSGCVPDSGRNLVIVHVSGGFLNKDHI